MDIEASVHRSHMEFVLEIRRSPEASQNHLCIGLAHIVHQESLETIAGQAGGRGAVRAFAEFILRAKGVDFAGMTRG